MQRISKQEWVGFGGIASPKTARKMISGRWVYYKIV